MPANPTFPPKEYHRSGSFSLLCSEWEEVGPEPLNNGQIYARTFKEKNQQVKKCFEARRSVINGTRHDDLLVLLGWPAYFSVGNFQFAIRDCSLHAH
mgnify:FL=1